MLEVGQLKLIEMCVVIQLYPVVCRRGRADSVRCDDKLEGKAVRKGSVV